ncbi:hypothetical protein B0H13DRAFT_1669786 [Mycena leptocephala]|nr:hypothetical protein B0H13DRAFT_1669786 [Mycena leptocephala]
MKGNPSKPATNFGVMVNDRDANGNPSYTTDGKLKKVKIPMTGGEFNGQPQSLYFPKNHELEDIFKGMAIILQERGLGDPAKKNNNATASNVHLLLQPA